MRVLVADDEKPIVKVLTEKLTEEGFIVDQAYDGEEALKKVEEGKPDLILLDIIMPKLDGSGVYRKLKENPATKDIPVIILTNLPEEKKPEVFGDLTETPYLVKVDYSLDEVVSQVKALLSKV